MAVCTNSCSIKPFQPIALIRYQNYIPLDAIQFSDSIYGLKTHYSLSTPPPPRGVLPCVDYIGMCGPKGYGFSAVLVINRVSIFAILVIMGYCFCTLVSNRVCFFRRSYFFIIINKAITTVLHKTCR